jgi:hypothetical protein
VKEAEMRALKEGKAKFKRQMEERAENEAQAEVSVIRASPWFVSRRLRDFQFPKETRKQIASNARYSDWLSLQLSRGGDPRACMSVAINGFGFLAWQGISSADWCPDGLPLHYRPISATIPLYFALKTPQDCEGHVRDTTKIS